MREILFKAKSVYNGEWIEGFYYKPTGAFIKAKYGTDDRHFIVNYDKGGISYPIQVDPETVSQFTGLLDKNGNKIFEGDLLRCAIENCCTGKVERFFECEVTYCKTMNAMGWYGKDERGVINKIPPEQEYLEVVGNKFDNPELVEKVEE